MNQHHRPKYYGYKNGSFVRVRKCESCGDVWLYEDCHPANPCFSCGFLGDEQKEKLTAKWVSNGWFSLSGKWVFAGNLK